MEKTSEVLKECMEKIKVSSAEIVVHGSMKKPYYEIKYQDLSDGHVYIGYSSYDLGNVFGWLEERFEIVKEDRHNMISEQGKELRKYCAELKEETMNRPIKTLEELVSIFCCLLECKNCPVMIHEYEKRTDNEKKNLHISCCINLYKWIVEQAKGE